ncbi:MAG: penicillin-binding protein 2 [Pseudomonadota bacterium]
MANEQDSYSDYREADHSTDCQDGQQTPDMHRARACDGNRTGAKTDARIDSRADFRSNDKLLDKPVNERYQSHGHQWAEESNEAWQVELGRAGAANLRILGMLSKGTFRVLNRLAVSLWRAATVFFHYMRNKTLPFLGRSALSSFRTARAVSVVAGRFVWREGGRIADILLALGLKASRAFAAALGSVFSTLWRFMTWFAQEFVGKTLANFFGHTLTNIVLAVIAAVAGVIWAVVTQLGRCARLFGEVVRDSVLSIVDPIDAKIAAGRMARLAKRPRSYVVSECGPLSERASQGITSHSGIRRSNFFAQKRIILVSAAFAIVFASLGVRLWTVSTDPTLKGRRLAELAATAGPRAEITDRNGNLLATNLPMRGIAVAGKKVWDPEETATQLAALFPSIDADDLADRLRQKRYVPLKEDLTPAQEAAVFALGLPGIEPDERLKRYYPQRRLAAHLVGQAPSGRGGIAGLERVLDDRKISPEQRLVSSIDIRVQQALEEELENALLEFEALAAWGGVMDVTTGEILALASLPDFDPNAPNEREKAAIRNHAVNDLYELGSVFKAFTAAAALQAGVAQEHSNYDARQPLRVADMTVRDYRGKKRVLSFTEVVQYSSNIGTALMAADLGTVRQRESLRALGLFERPNIELIERVSPALPIKWGPVEATTVSYGHGISVSTLHALSAFAAVVNGGIFNKPTVIRVDPDNRPDGRRVFSPEVSTVMRRSLRRVVADGTARQAKARGYYPIGKTGTAEKPVAGGYADDERINSFVGAFPGHKPRYAILVSLDDPKATEKTYGYATAGWNAAPLFSKVVRRIAPVLNVMPETTRENQDLDALETFLFSDAGPSGRYASNLDADKKRIPVAQPMANDKPGSHEFVRDVSTSVDDHLDGSGVDAAPTKNGLPSITPLTPINSQQAKGQRFGQHTHGNGDVHSAQSIYAAANR